MRITLVRRICQAFFFLLFLWFCLVATVGSSFWQLRGWPVNWFLELDPLVGLGTVLTTGALYRGLVWGLATVGLTIVLGRFFCGWVCPLGALQHLVGYWGGRRKTIAAKADANRYRRWQFVKYWLLVFLLASGVAELLFSLIRRGQSGGLLFSLVLVLMLGAALYFTLRRMMGTSGRALFAAGAFVAAGLLAGLIFNERRLLSGSLQTGLLDPLPLLYRSVNLVILPFVDGEIFRLAVSPRYYQGAWLIGAVFLAIVLLSLKLPRFYCRFVCPLGALFAVLSRRAVWRIGKTADTCRLKCHLCETHCEGACEPSQKIRSSECVLCLNCVDDCFNGLMAYRPQPSASGLIAAPDLSRRAAVVSLLSGVAAIPLARLGGRPGPGWQPQLIRPPGALDEKAFLARCIKCGQCMRVCPTNVIHPDITRSGLEGLWTPALDFRIGSSGCQFNCIACGNICPTGAIRPIRLDERLGIRAFAGTGPLKIGTAFVDRGRCLPWAMDRPCIVCQENCPVSPKAIFTRDLYQPVRQFADLVVKTAEPLAVTLTFEALRPERFATGDYYCRVGSGPAESYRQIVGNAAARLTISAADPWQTPPVPGSRIDILIRLKQPFIDIERCIGCGVCEHECPVKGKRAIRVTADNESRSREHALVLRGL